MKQAARPKSVTITQEEPARPKKVVGWEPKGENKVKSQSVFHAQSVKQSREIKNLSDIKATFNLSLMNSLSQLNQGRDSNDDDESKKKLSDILSSSAEASSLNEGASEKGECNRSLNPQSNSKLKQIRRNNNNSFPMASTSNNNNHHSHEVVDHSTELGRPPLVCLGQEHLYRLLKAICYNFPKIGYCQGMNFVVGFLLIITGANETDASWIFESLALNPAIHIIGLYEKDFPLLYLLVHIFWRRLQKEIPELYTQLKEIGLPDHVWITQWFMTFYLYSLPMHLVVRIWDFILSEDILSLIKVAIALLKIMKKDLMNMDTSDVSKYFKGFKEEENLMKPENRIDANKLIESARKIQMRRKDVSQFTREFLEETPAFIDNIFVKFYLKYDGADKQEYQRFAKEIADNYRRPENKAKDMQNYYFDHNTMPKLNKLD